MTEPRPKPHPSEFAGNVQAFMAAVEEWNAEQSGTSPIITNVEAAQTLAAEQPAEAKPSSLQPNWGPPAEETVADQATGEVAGEVLTASPEAGESATAAPIAVTTQDAEQPEKPKRTPRTPKAAETDDDALASLLAAMTVPAEPELSQAERFRKAVNAGIDQRLASLVAELPHLGILRTVPAFEPALKALSAAVAKLHKAVDAISDDVIS